MSKARKIIFAIAFTTIIFIWAFGSIYSSCPQNTTKYRKYFCEPRWTVGERLLFTGATLVWGAGLAALFGEKKKK